MLSEAAVDVLAPEIDKVTEDVRFALRQCLKRGKTLTSRVLFGRALESMTQLLIDHDPEEWIDDAEWRATPRSEPPHDA